MRNTTISDCANQGLSANVFADATLEVTAGTEISGNTYEGVYVWAEGTVLFDEATIANNGTDPSDAGIYIASLYDDGVMTVSRSTISGNIAHGIDGGATDNAVLDIVNSTISGNGLLMDVEAEFLLRHSTVTDNGASGMQLESGVGGTLITHSILAGNGGTGSQLNDLDIDGENVTIEWSIIGSFADHAPVGTPALIEGDGVQWNVLDAGLEPLADNGGQTLTHLLTETSPALDSGDAGIAAAPASDQRALVRIAGDRIDIGALEIQVEAAMLAATGVGVVWPLTGSIALLFGGLCLLGYSSVRRRRTS